MDYFVDIVGTFLSLEHAVYPTVNVFCGPGSQFGICQFHKNTLCFSGKHHMEEMCKILKSKHLTSITTPMFLIKQHKQNYMTQK